MEWQQDQSIEMHHRLRIPIVSILILLISILNTACHRKVRTNYLPRNYINTEDKKIPNISSNIHKQLNRVECITPEKCTEDVLSQIWYACIRNGYSTSPPVTEVTSGREIRELIEPEITITETSHRNATHTDQYGIVTDIVVSDKESKTYRKKSYCIGNEYITKAIQEK